MDSINKKNRYFALFIFIGFLFSCQKDFLEERPKDFLSTNIAYSTPEDVTMGITALHSYVRDWITPVNANAFCLMWGTDLGFLGDNPHLPDYMQNYITSLTPEHSHNNYFWSRAYTLIQRANVIIDAINKIDEVNWKSQEQKNQLL